MVDVVNAVTGGSAIAAVSQQSTSAPAAVTGNQTAQTTSSNSANTLLVRNRLYSDPSSGVFVSDQLNDQGQIVIQTPTASVLAYLRDGLTADGTPPKQSITA